MLRNADGVGGVKFSGKKRYVGVKFNVLRLCVKINNGKFILF